MLASVLKAIGRIRVFEVNDSDIIINVNPVIDYLYDEETDMWTKFVHGTKYNKPDASEQISDDVFEEHLRELRCRYKNNVVVTLDSDNYYAPFLEITFGGHNEG